MDDTKKPRNYLRIGGLSHDGERTHAHTTHEGDTQTTNDKNNKHMKQYNDQERTNKQRTSTTHEGLHTNATRGVRPTPKTPSRRHRGESLSSFSFPPKRMALELVYRANGVRRPSPRGPPAGVGSQRPFAACTRGDFAALHCPRQTQAAGLSLALQALQLFRPPGSQAYA